MKYMGVCTTFKFTSGYRMSIAEPDLANQKAGFETLTDCIYPFAVEF